ncbi:unnamed protein product [Tuber aestivum]|uniref:Uncharacterized protein n=1 Tax=Tuber aestivum TaxID=59557 RepID=A0A292PN79_9PEZI|nr:unnamed protein product [Tuber aestivum]
MRQAVTEIIQAAIFPRMDTMLLPTPYFRQVRRGGRDQSKFKELCGLLHTAVGNLCQEDAFEVINAHAEAHASKHTIATNTESEAFAKFLRGFEERWKDNVESCMDGSATIVIDTGWAFSELVSSEVGRATVTD